MRSGTSYLPLHCFPRRRVAIFSPVLLVLPSFGSVNEGVELLTEQQSMLLTCSTALAQQHLLCHPCVSIADAKALSMLLERFTIASSLDTRLFMPPLSSGRKE